MDELKPCPFCGGQPSRDDRCEYEHWTSSDAVQSGLGYSAGGITRTTFAIQCDCGIRIEGSNDQLLVPRWNRRPREDAGVVDEWRPIETAPRDGTRIIIGRPDSDGDGGISVCGYWLDELEDGVDYMGNDGGFTDVDYQVFQPGRSFGAESWRFVGRQPTHWRPLPQPPALAAALGKSNG